MTEITRDDLIAEKVVHLLQAYITTNQTPIEKIPEVTAGITKAVRGVFNLSTPAPVEAEPLKPAVPINKSVTANYIISLESGQKFKSLKRHLMTSYGLTPDQYRTKWGLAKDYPMVAPAYAKSRSALAKSLGLGRKPGSYDVAPGLTEPGPLLVGKVPDATVLATAGAPQVAVMDEDPITDVVATPVAASGRIPDDYVPEQVHTQDA